MVRSLLYTWNGSKRAGAPAGDTPKMRSRPPRLMYSKASCTTRGLPVASMTTSNPRGIVRSTTSWSAGPGVAVTSAPSVRATSRRAGLRSTAATVEAPACFTAWRSEEHTSELQSREKLVCRLLLEKKKRITYDFDSSIRRTVDKIAFNYLVYAVGEVTLLLLLADFDVVLIFIFFFFNDTATTEIYTLSLHDALPISSRTRVPDPYWCLRPLRRSKN